MTRPWGRSALQSRTRFRPECGKALQCYCRDAQDQGHQAHGDDDIGLEHDERYEQGADQEGRFVHHALEEMGSLKELAGYDDNEQGSKSGGDAPQEGTLGRRQAEEDNQRRAHRHGDGHGRHHHRCGRASDLQLSPNLAVIEAGAAQEAHHSACHQHHSGQRRPGGERPGGAKAAERKGENGHGVRKARKQGRHGPSPPRGQSDQGSHVGSERRGTTTEQPIADIDTVLKYSVCAMETGLL